MRLLCLSSLCLLALVALAVAPRAHARIYHCIRPSGVQVFSDQPCGTPAPSAASSVLPDPALGSVCAASPRQLRQSIARAFAARDVNRFAGLILWRHVDQSVARARLRSLSAWLRQPLAGIAIAYAAGPSSGTPESTAAGSKDSVTPDSVEVASQAPTGFEIATVGSTPRDFGVRDFGGCWWLTF